MIDDALITVFIAVMAVLCVVMLVVAIGGW